MKKESMAVGSWDQIFTGFCVEVLCGRTQEVLKAMSARFKSIKTEHSKAPENTEPRSPLVIGTKVPVGPQMQRTLSNCLDQHLAATNPECFL